VGRLPRLISRSRPGSPDSVAGPQGFVLPETASGPATSRALNLALLGHGKMGKAIAQLAPQRGFAVRLILTSESNRSGAGISPENFKGVDVCRDFTNPAAVLDNISRVAAVRCNLGVATPAGRHRAHA